MSEPHVPTTNKSNKRNLNRFFSNPLVGVIGSVASIVSLLLAIYFYMEGKEAPELVYYVDPARAVVVKAGQASRLTVSFDNKQIDADITASQLALWNQGKRVIKKDNILKSIVIYTERNVPILEAIIRKNSREIIHLSLGTEELEKGRLTVSWDILEQNDGGIIQLIYAGDPNVNIYVEGVLEGQSKIEQLRPSLSKLLDLKIGNPNIPNYIYRISRYVYSLAALVLIIFLIKSVFTKTENSYSDLGVPKWIRLTLLSIAILILIFMAFTSQSPSPPFGFE